MINLCVLFNIGCEERQQREKKQKRMAIIAASKMKVLVASESADSKK